MSKFSNAWACMKSSWWILKQDKELLLFPVFSVVASILVMISFALPVYNSGMLERLGQSGENDPIMYLVIFMFYLAIYFVIIFFNSGIIACAIKRTQGGDPTIAFGLRAAWARLPQILGWALLTGTVGFILRMLEERFEIVGRIIIALLGMAWTITSYMVVPVLVVEGKGPVDAYRESVSLLKHNWGEQLIGNIGFGLIFLVLCILPVILLIVAAVTGGGPAMITAVVISVIYLFGLALIQSTLQSIFQAAVYCYAVDGTAPEGFDSRLLADAFRAK